MAEDLVQATVNINVDGASGEVTGKGKSNSSIKIFKDILGTLKDQNQVAKKGLKLTQAGLLGGAGGALSGLAAKAALLATGGVAGWKAGEEISRLTSNVGAEVSFNENGERQVQLIDQKNQKIIETLTEEEALKRGILDKNMEVKRRYQTRVTIEEILNKDLEKIGKTVILTGTDLAKIANETYKQEIEARKHTEQMKEESRLRREILKRLAEKAKERYQEVKVDGKTSTLGYRDTERQQSIMFSQFERAYIDDLKDKTSISEAGAQLNLLQLYTPINGGN